MLLLIAFLLIGMVVSAQNLVTGVVTDTGGTPLPGVNIMLLNGVRAKAAVREKRSRHALQVVQPVVSIQVQNHARISFR